MESAAARALLDGGVPELGLQLFLYGSALSEATNHIDVSVDWVHYSSDNDSVASDSFDYVLRIGCGEDDLECMGQISVSVEMIDDDDDADSHSDPYFLSEESKDLILNGLLPLLQGRVHNVRTLTVSRLEASLLNPFLRIFRPNHLTSLKVLSCYDFMESSNVNDMKPIFCDLEEVELNGVQFSDESQRKLLGCMADTTTLKTAKFIHSSFSHATLSSIVAIIAKNRDLQSLAIMEGLCGANAEALRRFGQVVSELPRLHIVDISDNELSDASLAIYLTELQAKNIAISLFCSGNEMDVQSCQVIADILGNRESVSIVKLVLPQLSIDATKELCKGLRKNRSLRCVSMLGSFQVTVAMARLLSRAFAHITTLEEVNINPDYSSTVTVFEGGAGEIFVNGLIASMSLLSVCWNDGLTSEQQKQLDTYLRLNRFGRRHIVDPRFEVELWPLILARAIGRKQADGDGPKWGWDVLFWVVRNRPEVYDVRGSSRCKTV